MYKTNIYILIMLNKKHNQQNYKVTQYITLKLH